MTSRFKRIAAVAFFTAATLAAAGAGASAQTAAAEGGLATKPILFEVVSIRPVKSNISYGEWFTADGFSMHGIGTRSLLSSYEVHPGDRMIGIPDWAMHDQYDIEAKVAEADVAAWGKLPPPQKSLAVYAMLEDRFKLKLHRETRSMPGYALVVAKGGPKFKEATPGDTYPNGFTGLGKGPLLGVMMGTRRNVVSGQAVAMADVAAFLSMPAQKPVLDKTGLTGKYDLTLKFDPLPPPAPAPAAGGPAVASEPEGASVFTLVQEQLGLKLQPGATVPVEYIVIDHIEKPTEN